jgi:molybdopterin/thiamine biosynthesis adenylyltransferase
MFKLKRDELEMYKRQLILSDWGEEKQRLLKSKTVFVIGAGGLGSPVSINLAVAGVGEIRICDFDVIAMSNLNRQLLHNKQRIGMNKALSAKRTLEAYNENVKITAIPEKLTVDNINDIAGNADIIVDCLDNFETRYLINEYALNKGIPVVYGSVWGYDGRLTFIHYPETPCLQCIFEEAPAKETFPILGATTSVIGSLQAMETIKYLTKSGENITNKLLVWEGAQMSFRKFKIAINQNCSACSTMRKENYLYEESAVNK